MKKRNWLTGCIALLMSAWIFGTLWAEEPGDFKRTCGLSASLQEGQFDIIVPFWAGPRAVLAPAFGMTYVEDAGSEYDPGLVLRIYSPIKRVTPYWGLRAGAMITSPKEGKGTTDFLAGILTGGEFFVTPQFSVGIEAQVNLVKSDKKSARFGNPGGINVNTATAIVANVYF